MIKLPKAKNNLTLPALILLAMIAGGCAGTLDQSGGYKFQVNPFLWRASLEVISFIPLATTDPTGGVITTGWHSDAKKPNERFKLIVYILDRALRADALRVSVFRETRQRNGWRAAETSSNLAISIENLILTRARALRLGYEAAQ